MKRPSSIYNDQVNLNKISYDPEQFKAVKLFDEVSKTVYKQEKLFYRIEQSIVNLFTKVSKPQGIYLWGGVGRGKTHLMDLFYHSLKIQKKKRLHFHRFMSLVHDELTRLQGQREPIPKVVSKWAKTTQVLCLDELFISDIADAMIFAELLKCLFAENIILVTTTNIPPDELYRNGLQRDKFLPAITILKQNCQVHCLDSRTDYRMRVLKRAQIYHYPLDDNAKQTLKNTFQELSPDMAKKGLVISINHRTMQTIMCADSIAWFDFATLCVDARSVKDYIELAKYFHTVLISNIQQMTTAHEDIARRFVNMIDEFYDRNVTVIVSAAVDIHELYQGQLLKFEFERTVSRLLEMQSEEYLSRPHLG